MPAICSLILAAFVSSPDFGAIGYGRSALKSGVFIVAVRPGSPAYATGIRSGDLVFAVDLRTENTATTNGVNAANFSEIIPRSVQPGTSILFCVYRPSVDGKAVLPLRMSGEPPKEITFTKGMSL